MNKQLLIFDFDGTLIDSVPDLADATNTMLTTLGKDTYPIETIRNWIGNGSRLLVERALVGKVEVAEGELTVEEADHAEQIFFEAYKNLSGSKTVAYPDVDDGLKKLHAAGYTLALVTNKPIRFVPKILHSFGWQDLFSEVMGGDSLSVKKPDPAPLLHVCETLNVSVDQAVMIGDSRNDMLAGQNANMDTLGLSYGYNYGQDIRELNPTEAFDHFADLVAWVMKDRV
ncbi:MULTISPECIES: phosphoglycolate phosphatase [unclassified Psychrobacter]|uniref:phosphoglycolate phosphatase n=1 Tax=unclassified Psychrobacter TaxID=196806 RepID=UPI00086CC34C|nr:MULTISPECIES: phosphoglycolate phosphatase [unclassified Psychrobacter]MBA6243445.1 phosphoglycolate phosphatase [Psychrobacter sp. Urea-trap-18]MBA6286062.1 phosphoglycolate phosphatase [Psychrobacter sp. Urea-trap-16]MBA6318241.1 phosphoglycolate phosphatase [Psychrobacter sp. Urea-trap-20]MBA6333715.1 phosphoglycolate phosphatase [Psychrobacter sp. Urea-trap-19]OEH67725.1 MAG: phosphoglycolate phosphatase [Psychrobacter sp. B29-1]